MTSFNVTWNSVEKPVSTGKVFAKKRKILKTTGSDTKDQIKNASIKRIPTEIKYKKLHDGILIKNKQPESRFNDKFVFNNNDQVVKLLDSSPKLIKRKQKKDKIAAKLISNLSVSESTSPYITKSQTHSLFSVGHKEIHVKTNVRGKSVIEKVFSADKSFNDLPIHKYIVSNLQKLNFKTLTNVQEKSIPLVLKGKNLLIRSQTGSGKTLAYAVPILNALQSIDPKIQRKDGVQAIIVVPTRELALQTHELFGKINTFQWIVVGHLCGGENRNTEKTRLRKGVHILIATPGRLLDHMLHTNAFKLDNVRCLVLDEADRLLDMGFKKDIVRIVEVLDNHNNDYDPMALLKGKHNNVPLNGETVTESDVFPLQNPKSKTRQTLLLSATPTKDIAELADFTMKDHTYIDALDQFLNLNTELMVIPDTVQQKFIVTYAKHRLFTLSAMLIALAEKSSKIFLFMATGSMVDYHYELFTRFLVKMPRNRGKLKSSDVILLEGIADDSDDEEEIVLDAEVFKLHGSMDQSARKDVFMKFRAAKKGILLCTDVVARGIDVPTADCIIQYNGPQSVEDYLHRVGRTGRAGKSGTSYIFLTHEEQDFVTKMEDHKIYLKQHNPDFFLERLSLLMEEVDHERAAIAIQRYYENMLGKNKELHYLACLAYSSWSRFYNTYSTKMRPIFDFKKANLGHYVTSFGLKDTPTEVSRVVRGRVSNSEPTKLNRKLANHQGEQSPRPPQKRKIRSVSLITSEEEEKKKRKKGY